MSKKNQLATVPIKPLKLEEPDVKQLVNREDQVQLFGQALKHIRQGRTPLYRFFEWFGGPGIGKSQLIRLLISKKCQADDISFVEIDFSAPDIQAKLNDPSSLLIHIAQALNISNLDELEESVQIYRKSTPPLISPTQEYGSLSRKQRLFEPPAWLTSLEAVADAFITALMQEADASQPVVLFFDETEDATPDLIGWLEEKVFAPLLQNKPFIIVWAGRGPWRWRRPEIKRRLYSERLAPFDLDDVRKQFRAGQAVELADEFFSQAFFLATKGHPSAGAVAISQLSLWQDAGETLSSEFLLNHQTEMLNTIFTVFIEDYVFKDLEEDEKTACQLLALVRPFDTTMLQAILLEHGGAEFTDWTAEDFNHLFQRLKRTQLLIWQDGYALDPNLRHLIRSYYLLCERNTFIKINQTAKDVYEKWLKRPIDNLNLFVAEELYHLASLRNAGQDVDIASVFNGRLQLYQDRLTEDIRVSTLERLDGRINNDADLPNLLGETLDVLVEQIHSAIQNKQEAAAVLA